MNLLLLKAVALYVDEIDKVHYIYDTNHSLLSIPSPIKAIYNSGQIWKFTFKQIELGYQPIVSQTNTRY